ncbi:hypothetical protein [Pseudoalteromonas ruthenica]|uniref:hypothetical protein n=1 Tax=Pseudoalteromonas ruthenica TaxID=151081 RepID=UPI001487146B|nr:hypothetical protein [Pseudoalteromonas ruthenica]
MAHVNQQTSLATFIKELQKEVLSAVLIAGGSDEELVKHLTAAVSKAKGRQVHALNQ